MEKQINQRSEKEIRFRNLMIKFVLKYKLSDPRNPFLEALCEIIDYYNEKVQVYGKADLIEIAAELGYNIHDSNSYLVDAAYFLLPEA